MRSSLKPVQMRIVEVRAHSERRDFAEPLPCSGDDRGGVVGFEANHAGALASDNMTKMGITWVSFEGKRFEYKPAVPGEHYKLIVAATWEKVKQNPEAKRVLLSTGDLILKPDHHQEPNAPAAWRYFEILMKIRHELQNRDR